MQPVSPLFASFRPPGYGVAGWASLGLALSSVLVVSAVARAETLTAWQFDPATQQLTVTLPSGVTPQYSVESSPARIVLVLPQTQLGAVSPSQTYGGAVRQVSLSQSDDDTVVVLELAPDAALADGGASLVSLGAGDQTRWVLTALATLPGTAPSPRALGDTQMIVELPVLPGNDPHLAFPAPGTGRLSTSAANLMLPSDIDNLSNLPETLPVDPFNLGLPGEQVSVPSLAELDAVVGPVATAPQPTLPPAGVEPARTPSVNVSPGEVQSGAIATVPTLPSTSGSPSALTLEPPSGRPDSRVTGAPDIAAEPPTAEPTAMATVPAPSTAPPEVVPQTVAPIDSETSGIPIAVTPPESPSPELLAEGSSAIAVDPPPSPGPQAAGDSQPGVIAIDPPAMPDVPIATSAPVIEIAPPALPSAEGAIAAQPNAILQEPPPIATIPVNLAGTDPNLLSVPTAPRPTGQGEAVPLPPPLEIAAAGEPILFGTPLPNDSRQSAFPSAVPPLPAERPISPDTLVAAGTLLALQYVGGEPINLNTSSDQNYVLLLAQDIRDPITNGIVAPVGSQLIGQFESTTNGQRWVSKMLIAPAGQQVPFSSTSDYMVGSPDINTPRLAAGAGLGALALMLVTGFSGIGLIGGAIVGATTVVGTSPQHIVIEPNQVIQVQVIQDVPRSIPIASAPENSREWGLSGW